MERVDGWERSTTCRLGLDMDSVYHLGWTSVNGFDPISVLVSVSISDLVSDLRPVSISVCALKREYGFGFESCFRFAFVFVFVSVFVFVLLSDLARLKRES